VTRVSTRAVIIFVALAIVLAWAIALPLYFTGGTNNPYLALVAVSMMATPAIAALIVVRFVDRPASIPRELGLWPLGPARRFLTYLGLAIVLPLGLIVAALPIGAVLGLYSADLVNFSGFREVLAQQEAATGVAIPLPLGTIVALQLVNVLIGGVINTVPALGEELGWRGFLLPRLLPLGVVPAVLISGVIWGAWHAPLLLLGYNYPSAPGWLAVVMMCGMCTLVGAVFGWLRIRSQSVWPAALAHGTFNAAAGLALIFSSAGDAPNTTQATILGWSGWIVPLIVVVVLIATKSFKSAPTGATTT
jgi:membrane protease YdiL (CAAX protease family)